MTTSFLETITGLQVTTAIGRTLQDCQTVAANFDNTCDSTTTAVDLTTHVGAEMSCAGQMMCPDGSGSALYTTADPCTFTRKLCVSCSQVPSGEVTIRVQNNMMPNHCFQAINENPSPTEVDFSVLFNRDVTGLTNYSSSDIDTSAKTDELLCDIQRTVSANMLSGTGYSAVDESLLTTASAVAVSGALIFNALALGNVDAVENEWITLDQCLSHPTPDLTYHYHQWSPCAQKGNGWASTSESPSMCKDEDSCKEGPIDFAISKAYTDTSTYGEILGISRDGHMVYGPYNSDGELWTCADHDICNGAFIDGNYVYLSTTTFPYILGCFGPAEGVQTIATTCSLSSCPSDDDAGAGTLVASVAAAVASLALAAF